jgi:hypothetical protein
MDPKDESAHVWPTSADHEQSTAQVKDGTASSSSLLAAVFQLGRLLDRHS